MSAAGALLALLVGAPSSADDRMDPGSRDKVEARVASVDRRLERLRLELGGTRIEEAESEPVGATAREAVFLALNLHRRADRLCFELARVHVSEPGTAPVEELTAVDLTQALDRVLDRLRCATDALGVDSGETPEASFESPTIETMADGVAWTLDASRRLDRLLQRRLTASDVYQELTLAVSYLSRMLATSPGSTRLPEPPPFERGRTLDEVEVRLARCLDKLRQIAQRSGVDPGLRHRPGRHLPIDAGVVHDLTTVLVANLAYLHALRPGAKPPIQPFDPGFKTPSQIFQRVGIVERQLEELEGLAIRNPEWLSNETR